MKELSEMIRDKRTKDKKLSVRKLASIINERGVTTVTGQMITALEKGHRPPSYKLAHAIGDALELDNQEVPSAAFRMRVRHCLDRERSSVACFISELPERDRKNLDKEAITGFPPQLT